MANIVDFHPRAIWSPPLIKDSETPAWLGLSQIVKMDRQIGEQDNVLIQADALTKNILKTS